MIKRIIACRSQVTADACAERRAARYLLVPSRRNVEKWWCRAGVIKLHLQSTPHYNTATCTRGYPLRLVGKEQLTTGGVDDTEKKTALQCRHEGSGDAAPARAIAHDFAAFCSSIQATSSSAPPAVLPPPLPPHSSTSNDISEERSRGEYPPSATWYLTILSRQFNTFSDTCLHQDVIAENFYCNSVRVHYNFYARYIHTYSCISYPSFI